MLLEECSFASEPRGMVPAVPNIKNDSLRKSNKENRTTNNQYSRAQFLDTYRTPNPEKGISQYLPSLIVGSQVYGCGIIVDVCGLTAEC